MLLIVEIYYYSSSCTIQTDRQHRGGRIEYICELLRTYLTLSLGVVAPSKSWGGGYYNHGLNKYFPADFWLYTYQFCYISGAPIYKGKNGTNMLESCWL